MKPKIRGVGFYSDSSIYIEVLNIAKRVEYFTRADLKEHLVNHVKGLRFKDQISDTGLDNLIRELYLFGWVKYFIKSASILENKIELFNRNNTASIFCITNKGSIALDNYYKNRDFFFDELIVQLYDLYTIPAWFIQRLWDINAKGQGLITIPAPIKNWNPVHKDWNDNQWNSELSDQLIFAYKKISTILPGSFPIDLEIWLNETEKRWNNIANTKPRKDKEIKHVFTPRKRLALAMKESAIKLLFSNNNPITGIEDFEDNVPPLLPRLYAYWCSRLEEIGLLNYTDYNSYVPGRIIYPVCSFNYKKDSLNFRIINNIKNTRGQYLVLHRPKWEQYRELFYSTLYEEYKKIYLKVKSLYVSIQDVRDEVCQILRLSNFIFDKYIEIAANEALLDRTNFRIAIETDVREDQRKTLQRRPVYFNNNIISLIAITDK